MATWSSVLGARLRRWYGQSATAGTWTDAQGEANATQATSSRQGTVTTSPSGANVYRLSGDGNISGANADVYAIPAAGASTAPTHTVFGCLLRVPVGFANDGIASVIVTFGARLTLYLYTTTDTKLRAAAFNNGTLAEQTVGTIDDGLWHRVIVDADEATNQVTLWIDRVSQTTTATGSDNAGINFGTTGGFIGANDAAGGFAFNGFIGEIGIGQDSNSFAGDIAAIDAMLAERLGVHGTLSVTLGATTVSAAGTTGVVGALSKTLAPATLAAAGSAPASGSAAVTLAPATLAAAGSAPASGSAAATLAPATLAAAGSSSVSGSAAATLAPATLAAAGSAPVSGSAAATLAPATLAATAGAPVVGAINVTLAPATLAATGAVVPTVTGSLSVTLQPATVTASGSARVGGALSKALAAATLAATGSAPVSGTVSTSLAAATLAAQGTARVFGGLAVALAPATLAGTGGPVTTVTGSLSVTLQPSTLVAVARSPVSATLAVTLAPSTLAAGNVVPDVRPPTHVSTVSTRGVLVRSFVSGAGVRVRSTVR